MHLRQFFIPVVPKVKKLLLKGLYCRCHQDKAIKNDYVLYRRRNYERWYLISMLKKKNFNCSNMSRNYIVSFKEMLSL